MAIAAQVALDDFGHHRFIFNDKNAAHIGTRSVAAEPHEILTPPDVNPNVRVRLS